ncbi:GNAT family N-acetyltransferase [Allorhizocola rhizosphaerae]|uniref:GNAT family N-acetyltransferase n=1 Tax=Allorhizocola rhizosphaerae TaxID=1872709 RepID=UPI001B8AA0D9|nr:GNAT family N-acetyltransferase [Allorhizocola rhizosphaerae]
MTPQPQPVLHATTERGEKIMLRPAEPGDVEAIFTACTDPETLAWTTLPLDYDRARAVGFVEGYAPGWWERGDGACWVIADAADAYAGQLDLRIDPRDRQVADVGFLTAPHARGRGYMTTALRAACEFGFEHLGLERIEWRAHVGNDGSRKVAGRVGFQLEGVQRAGVAQRGQRRDAWVAALLKGDPR